MHRRCLVLRVGVYNKWHDGLWFNGMVVGLPVYVGRCRSFMSDTRYTSEMSYLQPSDLSQLESGFPTSLCARSPKSSKYKDMIHKYANRIAIKPFHMTRASEALKSWVEESDGGTDLLDASNCRITSMPQISNWSSLVSLAKHHSEAMALEPEPSELRLANAPAARKPKGAGITLDAKISYNIAATLVKRHGKTWSDAISMAEKIYKSASVGSSASKVLSDETADLHSDEDAENAVLDTVPVR